MLSCGLGEARTKERSACRARVGRSVTTKTKIQGAIEAFTKTLAAEVGYKGITVNSVNPGPTQTGWMDGDLEKELAAKFPGGRVGEPEDAARLVAFLASDEAAWITGQILHSEGGFLHS